MAESLLGARLREFDELIADRKALRDEHRDLRETLTRVRRGVEMLQGKLTESEQLLLAAQEACERTTMGVALSNNAGASRYIELKKRLDAYDNLFRLLGVQVQNQSIGPLAAAAEPPAAPADSAPPK
jgi:predicted  nucleic acid-binding Zn-ribbon protein